MEASAGASAGSAARQPRRSAAFLATYALANVGGVMAFLPLLTLLLPVKVEMIAGPERLGVLSAITIFGAMAAGGANILFGALSDRTYAAHGTRKPWIIGGLVGLVISYGAIWLSPSVPLLIAAVMFYQVVLNMTLGPLYTMIADDFPDEQKGVVGGLLSFASPLSSFVGGALAYMRWHEGERLFAVVIVTVLCILPLLLVSKRRAPLLSDDSTARAPGWRDFSLAVLARLLFQIAGAVLFTYLVFYFEAIPGSRDPLGIASVAGHLTGIVFLIAIPIAVGLGRLSDRLRARKAFLLATAILTAIGLLVMSIAHGWTLAVVGYGLFAWGNAAFLGLHSALTAQILPAAGHRGRDMGIMNLANTVPSMLGPLLAWWLATVDDFGRLFQALAVLTLLGGIVALGVSKQGDEGDRTISG